VPDRRAEKAQSLGDALEALVAREVAVVVVVALEEVHVDHGQRNPATLAAGPPPLRPVDALEVPAVGEAGQPVQVGEPLQLGVLAGLTPAGVDVQLVDDRCDVIDYDELRSGKRREGAFSSAWSWTIKAGMVTASVFAGRILDRFTGFDAALRGAQSPETMLWIRLLFACVPITACVVALILLSRFNLSTERMASIRRELEARRGVV